MFRIYMIKSGEIKRIDSRKSFRAIVRSNYVLNDKSIVESKWCTLVQRAARASTTREARVSI